MTRRVEHSLFLGVLLVAVGCAGDRENQARPGAADASRSSDADVAEAGAAPVDASSDHRAPPSSEAGAPPARLSETGLFADIVAETLAPGVQPYEPQGVLWADGATKRRWVFLPPGTRIDTSDMDHWSYPVGTKLWKEFSLDGQRLETRFLEKRPDASWNLVAYQWKTDLSDAVAVPDGVPDAAGTPHDIPSTGDCQRCHGGLPDDVLGFTAVQLSHPGAGVTMDTLAAGGLITNVPAAPLVIPGDAVAQDALRYLHANCGQCHNSRSFVTQQTGYGFWLNANTLTSVEHTATYQTAMQDLRGGGVAGSTILTRMRHRGNGQMPPLATKDVDDGGAASVEAWLRTLAPAQPRDGGSIDGSVTDAALSDR